MVEVRPDVMKLFGGMDVAAFLAIDDTVVRAQRHRSIGYFERDGRRYYIKKHRASGWWPIVEDVVRLRRPQVGAWPEYLAIRACERLGVPTMAIAAFGREGFGASAQSFIITDEITPAVSLEDFFRDRQPPEVKNRLNRAVADITRRMHEGGVNHRDCYLCHFFLDPRTLDKPQLRVIDLHRAQVRDRTNRRWIIKDLAGLYFSAMDIGLSRRDVLRFMARYGRRDPAFWAAVERRAQRTYRDEFGRKPPALA